MTTGYPFAVALSLLFVLFVLLLLRTRRLREKYAAIWLVLAAGVCVLAASPGLAFRISELTGVKFPINLLFSAAILVLLVVCIQLSSEVTSLEEETRTLAEEIALLGNRLDTLESARGHAEEDAAQLESPTL